MTWYWLSFAGAGGQHLGVAVVKGETLEEAVQSSWELSCNPGNCEVHGFGPFTLEEMRISPAGVEQLLLGDDIARLGVPFRHTDEIGAA